MLSPRLPVGFHLPPSLAQSERNSTADEVQSNPGRRRTADVVHLGIYVPDAELQRVDVAGSCQRSQKSIDGKNFYHVDGPNPVDVISSTSWWSE